MDIKVMIWECGIMKVVDEAAQLRRSMAGR